MAESSTPRRFILLALALAALVVAVGGLNAYRKLETFQPLGFEVRQAGGGWQVTAVDGAEALEVGDQILLINGASPANREAIGGALRARAESELILLRGEEVENLTYALPPLAIDWAYLALAAIGLGYLLIGFYTLLRQRRPATSLFYLWCLTSAVVYLFTAPAAPFDGLDKTSYLLEELARLLLAPMTLHLFAVFPRPLSRSAALNRLIPFFYLPAAFLLGMQVDLVLFGGAFLFGNSAAAGILILDRLELFHLALLALAASAVLVWRLRRTKEKEPHRQALWIAVGMAAGYLPFLVLYVLPYSLGLAWPAIVTTLAVLPLALVPLTFAYAILRYRLWDLGTIVRDSMSLSITVLIGVFGFSLANMTVNRLVPEDLGLGRTAITFVSGLMIAGLLVPTRRGLNTSFERLQYRSRFSRRRALAQFGRELLRERNLESLVDRLGEQLDLGLGLQKTNLFLAHGQSLMPVANEPALPDMLTFDALDSDFWEAEYEALTGIDEPAEELTARQRLFNAGYRYAFPLAVRDSVLGMVLTGYRDNEIPLSNSDLELVRGLLNQAALAIENAQLLDQVHRQLEEMVRLQNFNQGIIQSSPAGIAVLDPQGLIHSANPAFGNLTGVEGRIEGKPLRELMPIEPLPRPDEGIREISFRDSDGRQRYAQISVAPFGRRESEDLRVLVVQDVSERVEMENELKEKDRLASLGMLAAGVAHEVNTPITGISSYAQMLLAETPETDPRYQLLKKVEKQTFRAAEIVSNLLDFARNREPVQGVVELGAVVGECLELLGERIDENGVTTVWEPPSEPVYVNGNDGELLQVFSNLALNAVQAMESGGTLSLQLERHDSWVWASVEDTGPGISPRELDKIFQPFFSSKLGSGGTGLGLAITYNIVRRHGGDIRVISQPGEGTRFIVELPLRDR